MIIIYKTPLFHQEMNDGQGGYSCGHCGSADDWIEAGPDTGCHACGTRVTREWADRMAELDL